MMVLTDVETSAEPFLQARKRGAHPSTILLTCSPVIIQVIIQMIIQVIIQVTIQMIICTGEMLVKILDFHTDHVISKTYDQTDRDNKTTLTTSFLSCLGNSSMLFLSLLERRYLVITLQS